MENATKALIITSSVLFAITVLSIGVYLKGNMQNTADSYLKTIDTTQLREYNTHFELYADTKRVITAQDIVTLVEFAKKYEQGTKVFVKESKGGFIERTTNTFNASDFLKNNITYEDANKIYKIFSYVNNSIKYDTFGKVSEIRFSYVNEKEK